MSADLLAAAIAAAVVAALAAAGFTIRALRRASQKVRRIRDGRRWERSARVDPDNVLDLIAEAEGITRRAAQRRRS